MIFPEFNLFVRLKLQTNTINENQNKILIVIKKKHEQSCLVQPFANCFSGITSLLMCFFSLTKRAFI